MKALYFVLNVFILMSFFSFKTSEPCEYVGSNIGYVKTQTGLALENNDLNKTKFLTYKAIKAIYNLRKHLDDCGCDQAILNIDESRLHLKKVTKATSMENAKSLLRKAYQKTDESLKAIQKHQLKENIGQSEVVVLDHLDKPQHISSPSFSLDKEDLHILIDDSLIPYEESLQKVVDSLHCKDAKAYAERIFKICEQELLKPDLSEGKKYYNLKTQEITADALKQLSDCETSFSK